MHPGIRAYKRILKVYKLPKLTVFVPVLIVNKVEVVPVTYTYQLVDINSEPLRRDRQSSWSK